MKTQNLGYEIVDGILIFGQSNKKKLSLIYNQPECMVSTYKRAENSVPVFVCGLSNSGKSALINSLIGRDAAPIHTDDNDGTTSIHQYEGPNLLTNLTITTLIGQLPRLLENLVG